MNHILHIVLSTSYTNDRIKYMLQIVLMVGTLDMRSVRTSSLHIRLSQHRLFNELFVTESPDTPACQTAVPQCCAT